MSAIGSYALVKRGEFRNCLARARQVRSETTGKWVFKKSQVVGIEEFNQAWHAAVVKEVDFDYSGYVIGNYLDAQSAVNGSNDAKKPPAGISSQVVRCSSVDGPMLFCSL